MIGRPATLISMKNKVLVQETLGQGGWAVDSPRSHRVETNLPCGKLLDVPEDLRELVASLVRN